MCCNNTWQFTVNPVFSYSNPNEIIMRWSSIIVDAYVEFRISSTDKISKLANHGNNIILKGSLTNRPDTKNIKYENYSNNRIIIKENVCLTIIIETQMVARKVIIL